MSLSQCPDCSPKLGECQEPILILIKQHEHLFVIRDLLLGQLVCRLENQMLVKRRYLDFLTKSIKTSRSTLSGPPFLPFTFFTHFTALRPGGSLLTDLGLNLI